MNGVWIEDGGGILGGHGRGVREWMMKGSRERLVKLLSEKLVEVTRGYPLKGSKVEMVKEFETGF